jgi:hypothetical protein
MVANSEMVRRQLCGRAAPHNVTNNASEHIAWQTAIFETTFRRWRTAKHFGYVSHATALLALAVSSVKSSTRLIWTPIPPHTRHR